MAVHKYRTSINKRNYGWHVFDNYMLCVSRFVHSEDKDIL